MTITINEQFNAACFTQGPTEKDGIAIHWWGLPQGQTIQSVRDTFVSGARQSSAHFGASAGIVDCYVNPDDVAWANGNWAANLSKISIECNPRQSDDDYYAAAWTIAYIRSIYGNLPLHRHSEFFATQCCGNYDLVRLDAIARTIKIDGSKTPTPGKPVAVKPSVPAVKAKTIAQLADEVIAGAYGTGDQRRLALGSQFDAVQAAVNAKLLGTSAPKPKPNISALADAVLRGEYGNGDHRITALGSSYAAVQNEINRRAGLKAPAPKPAAKPAPKPAAKPMVTIDDLVRRTLAGEFGNGDERIRRLGSNYNAVQARINGGAPNIKALADAVIRGEYGSGDERIRRLGTNYNAVQAEVNRRYQ